jgi:acetyltransferase
VPRAVRAGDAAAAVAAQAAIGGPVAIKLVSRTIAHKSDVGGVVLDVRTPEEAAAAVDRIAASLRARGTEAAMDGVLVQEMAPPGVDLIVGGLHDRVFGPCLLVGVGGVQAETWGDRRVALAPAGPSASRELWDGLRGAALLDGARGLPPVSRAALADLTSRVGWLVSDVPGIAELDLNPVRAAAGGRPLALDARIRRAETREPAPSSAARGHRRVAAVR